MTGSRKTLILGCASTGAKFTPRNHAATGDRLLDSICTGATIRTAPGELLDEARQLYEMGCRYYHYHARNPLTQEQTTDNDIYQAVSRALQNRFPDLMLSFGASRNGSEVQENIRRFGEWERVSHCAIPLHLGGAHFVTIQAAIELQVICELEKQRRKLDLDYASSPAFLADLRDYQPSTALERAELQTHSTSKGADYGVTSPMTQFQVYRNAIQARQKLGLFHEVEWVQHVRSYAMTRFAVEHPRLRLGGSGQLNVILLFGFSPRLPFPETYQQFRAVIESAKSLEYDIGEPGVRKRKVRRTARQRRRGRARRRTDLPAHGHGTHPRRIPVAAAPASARRSQLHPRTGVRPVTAALAANPTQRYRWVILLIATFAQACACFFVQGIGAIAVFIQNDLQLSSLQIGLLVSAAQLVPIVGLLVAGELLDRYSERLVVGLGTLIVALALCASLWATDYLTILLFLVVVGAGYSTAQPGGSKSVSRWFAKTQLGFAMGIRQAGLPLGGALSAALLPYLAGIYGWRSAFLAGGLVAFLGALAFMLFYRTPPDAPAPGANPAERDLGAVVKSRLAMITDPAMKNIVCSGVALISVQYGILVFTVLYLHETLEIGIGMAATLLFVAQGSGVAGRILLAAWSDRCRAGRYFPVMVCLGAVILGLLALVLLPLQSPLGMGLVVAWLGFFGFGWYGPWVAYVADTAPVGKTGFALGLAMAINQLAIVLAPPALGLLKDFSHSFVPGWLALCLMAAVALVVTAWSGRGLPTALPQKH